MPEIQDANFAFGITASEPAQIERLLTRMAREYAHAARLTFRVDPYTPPAFEARLALEGYERSDAIVLIIDGPPRGTARRFQIRAIEDEASWLAYSELKFLDWREYAARTNARPPTPPLSIEIPSNAQRARADRGC